MKEFIVKNIEKVLLTALLLVLAISSVLQILSMDRPDIDVLPPKDKGFFVKMPEIPTIADTQVSLKENIMQPYDAQNYIYCRRSDCDYLIRNTETKCPWCNTDTRPVDELKLQADTDGDGIPDKIEIEYGLDKDNPKDATLDNDEDGFANIDEIKSKNSPVDSADHPLIIKRTYLRGFKPEYFKLRIATIDTGDFKIGNAPLTPETDLKKDTWDIYMDVVVKGKLRSRYFKINDKDKDLNFTIVDLGVENKKPFVLVKMSTEGGEDETIKFFESKRPKVKTVMYYFYNELNKKYYPVEMGQEFFLENLKNKKERYKLNSYNSATREAEVTAYRTSQKVKVGPKSELEKPGARTEPGSEFEGLDGEIPEF